MWYRILKSIFALRLILWVYYEIELRTFAEIPKAWHEDYYKSKADYYNPFK